MNGCLQSTLGSLLESHWSKTKGAFPRHIPQQGLTPPTSPRSNSASVDMYTFLDASSSLIVTSATGDAM